MAISVIFFKKNAINSYFVDFETSEFWLVRCTNSGRKVTANVLPVLVAWSEVQQLRTRDVTRRINPTNP